MSLPITAFAAPNYQLQESGVNSVSLPERLSSAAMTQIAHHTDSEWSLIVLQDIPVELGQFALERFLTIARNTSSSIVYSDYYDLKDGRRMPHPVTDYQPGSIRDDFNFGALVLVNSAI